MGERIMEDISKWSVEKRSSYLEKLYEERMNARLDLDNPKKFTEKIQWIKLYSDDKRISTCIDKLKFKQYVRESISGGYTAELIDVWHNQNDVDIWDVPAPCVIKSNCSSDGNYVFVIKEKKKDKFYEFEKILKEKCFDRLYLNTNSFFKAYYDVKPCVIVEEYISEIDTGVDEYKFFCFSGEPKCVYHSDQHFDNGKKANYTVSFFSMDWDFLNVRYGNHGCNANAPKPKHMDEMVEICRRLSSPFPFVRVDFFESSSRFYLAEMTFACGGGLVPYYPESFDYQLGEWWEMDKTTNKNGVV